jgi:hypothetical protein
MSSPHPSIARKDNSLSATELWIPDEVFLIWSLDAAAPLCIVATARA